jgi:cell division protein FtsQ
LLRSGTKSIWRRRRLRFALLALLVLLPLLSGGWLWLRHSSLVEVRRVQVSGLHGPEAHAIDVALTNAARHMSTLDVHTGVLRAAAAPFRIVRDVRVSTSFPHGLHIHVIEQPPVAALTVAGTRTAVAADGVVLGPALLSGSLPAVSAAGESVISGHSVRGSALLGALGILGAAPAPLAKTIERAYSGPKGLTVAMSGGLLAYFGDGGRPHAKWIALARVLADPSSAGASYVDVRLPERPAAGFAPGTAPPSSTTSEQSGSESGEDLATGLAAAVPGNPSVSSESAESESQGAAEAPAEGNGEASGEESSEASSETPPSGR